MSDPLHLQVPHLSLKWSEVPADHPKCMQCGKPSTCDVHRDGVKTTWCDTHAPTVWQMTGKRGRDAQRAMQKFLDEQPWELLYEPKSA